MRSAAESLSTGIGFPSAVFGRREVEDALGLNSGGKEKGSEWRLDLDTREEDGGSDIGGRREEAADRGRDGEVEAAAAAAAAAVGGGRGGGWGWEEG